MNNPAGRSVTHIVSDESTPCPVCGRGVEKLGERGAAPQYHLECRRYVDALSIIESAAIEIRYESKGARNLARRAFGSLANRLFNASPVGVTDTQHSAASVEKWRAKMERRKRARMVER